MTPALDARLVVSQPLNIKPWLLEPHNKNLVSDFNLLVNDCSDSKAIESMYLIISPDFTQDVKNVTHNCENTLDLIFFLYQIIPVSFSVFLSRLQLKIENLLHILTAVLTPLLSLHLTYLTSVTQILILSIILQTICMGPYLKHLTQSLLF